MLYLDPTLQTTRRHDPRDLGPPKFGRLFWEGKNSPYFQRGSLGVGEEIIYFIWSDGGWIFVETIELL